VSVAHLLFYSLSLRACVCVCDISSAFVVSLARFSSICETTVGDHYNLLSSFSDFSAGLTVGMSGLAAGFAIGVAGDIGVRSYAQQLRMYVPMVLILIFSEAIGLYGTIVSILLITNDGSEKNRC